MTVRTSRAHTASELLFGCFAFFCLLLILRNAEIAVEYMTRGLLLCARTVIPSLFPFMILSELVVTSGLADRLLARLCAPMCRVLRLPTGGCVALILGLLCGFPVGARCAIAAYERGELSREGCERVLGAASPPSSAFVMGAVGVSLWSNRALGISLYLSVIASALLTCLFTSRRASPVPVAPIPIRTQPSLGAAKFTGAVRASTESMLLICAYVVFFSALTGTLGMALSSLGANETLRAVLTAIFEMSSGVSALSALSPVAPALILSAATLGWSGLSVHCQMLALCQGHDLSLRTYFLSKLLQALLCALICALLIHFFPSIFMPTECRALGNIYLL
ncbi:MAG: hypothetical protein IJW29_03415 [Clostridia bacterium]|nr:hypothetical protein [Clostridia bacterium]